MPVTGYKYKCQLTIDRTKVGADVTDFPVLLTAANLPPDICDSDGARPALEGGGDIRFSSDSAGATQLPCEVVHFIRNTTPANASCQIWVKVPSVTVAVNATFFIHWGKVGDTQPAVSDTYGRNAVWTGYGGVWHLQENNTLSGQLYIDSTGNSNDLSSDDNSKVPNRTTGKVDYGQNFDDAANDLMFRNGTSTNMSNNTFLFSCWARRTTTSGGAALDRLLCRGNDDRFDIGVNGSGVTGEMQFISNGPGATGGWVTFGYNMNDTNFHHIAASHSGGTVRTYKDSAVTSRAYTVVTQDRAIGLGCKVAGIESLDCVIDEARWFNGSIKSDGWVTTEYNCANNPATFLTPGSVIVNGKKSGAMAFFW